MKKLKILSLALVFALVLGTLAGCSGISVSSLYNTKKVNELAGEVKMLNNAEKLAFDDELVDSFGDVLVFKSSSATHDTYTFYSVSSKSVIHTETQNINRIEEVELVGCVDGDFIFYVRSTFETVDGEPQYRVAVFDSKGVQIKEFVSDSQDKADKAVPEFNLDLLKIGTEFYRKNRKGVYKLTATVSSSDLIPEFDARNGNLYYSFGNDAITVFNEKLEIVYYYQFPTYLVDAGISILNNGKILIQYSMQLLETDKNYDFIEGDIPVKLVSKIIDVKNDKVKEVDLDYLVALQSRDTLYAYGSSFNFEILKKSIDNIGYLLEIEEERLNETPKVASFNDKGKIVEKFDQMFEGQNSPEFGPYGTNGLPEVVGADRYSITNTLGQKILLDGKGNKVGDITDAIFLNGKYVIMDDGIYDMNLVEVASIKDYVFVTALGNLRTSMIFTKEVGGVQKYYLFTNGEFKYITDYGVSTVETGANYLILKNVETGIVSIFNENLEQILNTDAQISVKLYSAEYGVVLSGYNQTTSKYETYLISTVVKK